MSGFNPHKPWCRKRDHAFAQNDNPSLHPGACARCGYLNHEHSDVCTCGAVTDSPRNAITLLRELFYRPNIAGLRLEEWFAEEDEDLWREIYSRLELKS